jgi:hypothetical protein
LQEGVEVVTSFFASDAADETGKIALDFSRIPPTPTAAVASAALLMKDLLFADSIVDSGVIRSGIPSVDIFFYP